MFQKNKAKDNEKEWSMTRTYDSDGNAGTPQTNSFQTLRESQTTREHSSDSPPRTQHSERFYKNNQPISSSQWQAQTHALKPQNFNEDMDFVRQLSRGSFADLFKKHANDDIGDAFPPWFNK